MKPDYSDISGERAAFAKAWKIIEKYRYLPVTAEHCSEWDGVAFDCMDLAQCADKDGAAAAALANGMAHALMQYYREKLKDLP